MMEMAFKVETFADNGSRTGGRLFASPRGITAWVRNHLHNGGEFRIQAIPYEGWIVSSSKKLPANADRRDRWRGTGELVTEAVAEVRSVAEGLVRA